MALGAHFDEGERGGEKRRGEVALEAGQLGEGVEDAGVQAVEEQRHAAEVVRALAREVGLEARDARVHDLRAAAQQVVRRRALVDVPGGEQRQRGLPGLHLDSRDTVRRRRPAESVCAGCVGVLGAASVSADGPAGWITRGETCVDVWTRCAMDGFERMRAGWCECC